MRLDLSCVDTDYLHALRQRLQNAHIAVTTLYREQIVHPDAARQAYFCHHQCRLQQPPVELRQEPIAFDKWRGACMEGADAAPELYFLAALDREYIGVCMLEKNRNRADVLTSGFTGVLPGWAGRGVAKALKAHSLLCAQERGCRYVETSVLAVNRAMCAINRSLGFAIVRKHLHAYPIPVSLSGMRGQK